MTGSPFHRISRGETRTSQVTGSSSSYVPWCNTSPDSTPPNPLLYEKLLGEAHIAFTKIRTLGIRNDHSFRSHVPTAHTLACLRFADTVTGIVARLATGSGGLTPGRAGFAPAGRQTKFHGVIANPPIPIDQQGLVALYFQMPVSNPTRKNRPAETIATLSAVSIISYSARNLVRRIVFESNNSIRSIHPVLFYLARSNANRGPGLCASLNSV